MMLGSGMMLGFGLLIMLLLIGLPILLGVALLGGTGVLFRSRNQPPTAWQAPQQRMASNPGAQPVQPPSAPARYCSHCGAGLQADWTHCPQCGAPING
jgi:hypothetical protein